MNGGVARGATFWAARFAGTAIRHLASSIQNCAARAARGAPGVRTAECDDRLGERHGKAGQRGWEPRTRKPTIASRIQSTAGHVESRGNHPGPSGKAKYSLATDSDEYREGKVKRTPGGEWKRTWNRMPTSSRSIEICDGVPFVEWTSELRSHARLRRGAGAGAKASLKRARVCGSRPETVWSTHGQVEALVKQRGGPNQPSLKRRWMSCG